MQKKIKGDYCLLFLFLSNIFKEILKFILLLIFAIFLYVKGISNINITKANDNANKIKFIEIACKISIIYFIFLAISILLHFLYLRRTIAFRAYKPAILFTIISLINLSYFILIIIRYCYSNDINNSVKDKEYKPINSWLIDIDKANIILNPSLYFIMFCSFICLETYPNSPCEDDDEIIWILNQFKGVNVWDYKFPYNFENLNIKEKNKFVLTNVEKYEYKLNQNQIDIVKRINQIRERNSIPLLQNNEFERIPDFIINEKTEIILYYYKNIFKLKKDMYLFRYEINELNNLFDNKEILNILKILCEIE